MLEYDRIDVSEGIDVNKTNASKECDICHYWYFKDIGFKYGSYLCNGCHGIMQKAMNPKFEVKYLRNLGASLRNTCEGAHIDQSLWASASNFTKHETPSRVFPKDPAHLLGTPIIPRNIFQCQPLIIFVLSKYMYFIVILTSVFGLFIFTRFNDSNYMCKYGTYTFLRPMV